MKSDESRRWLLEGLPLRNRLHHRFLHPWLFRAFRKYAHKKWQYRLVKKLYRMAPRLLKEVTPPDTEAEHTRWGRTIKMHTPRMQSKAATDWVNSPRGVQAWASQALAGLEREGARSAIPAYGMTPIVEDGTVSEGSGVLKGSTFYIK